MAGMFANKRPVLPFVFWGKDLKVSGYDLFTVLESKGFARFKEERESDWRTGRLHNNILEYFTDDEVESYVTNKRFGLISELPEMLDERHTRDDLRRKLFDETRIFIKSKFNIFDMNKFERNR